MSEPTYRLVRVATSGRRCRLYVGKINQWRIYGGPRPIEQIVAVIAGLAVTTLAALGLNYPVPAVFAVGLLLTAAATVAVGFIPYEGVPLATTVGRAIVVLVDRRPTIVAAEDLQRQDAAGAFLPAPAEPQDETEAQ